MNVTRKQKVLVSLLLTGIVLVSVYTVSRDAIWILPNQVRHLVSWTSPPQRPRGSSLAYRNQCLAACSREGFRNVNESTEGQRQRFPQAMIIGVGKAGTKALKVMLDLHPQIVTTPKEVHFFDHTENFAKGLQWYLHQMPATKPDEVTIEKTPEFANTCSPERIHYFFPHVKLILVVRDPIDRAVSQYLQQFLKNVVNITFEEKVLTRSGELDTQYIAINQSLYDYHLKRWLQYFSLEQMHIVHGDKISKDNPTRQLVKVAKFLNLQPYFKEEMFFFNKTKGFYCWKQPNPRKPSAAEVPTCLGGGKGRQHPTISEAVLEKMRVLYKPHMQEFYKLIGQEFGWDLE